MKRTSGSAALPLLMLILGGAALGLRKALYETAVDAKGLLLRNHPLGIALAALTVAVFAIAALSARKAEDAGCFEDCYGANWIAALGSIADGIGILMTVRAGNPAMGGYLGSAWRLLGLAAPVCLILAGFARALGKRPCFLLHVVVCLFFVLHIVTHYQLWSGNPQLQDYLFSLLGAMMLMFFGFYAAALETGCGHARMTLGMGLAAIYLCMAELGRTSDPWLYLGGILWVLTDLVSLRKITADQQNGTNL